MKLNKFNFKKLIFTFGIYFFIGAIFVSFFWLKKSQANINLNTVNVSHAVSDYDEYANNLVSEILANNSVTESSYSLKNNYPIFSEDQDNSNLCWIYSASKALETTLMIKTGEYYNFSEIAGAYFAYKYGENNIINSYGYFEKFDDIIRNYGIVLESEAPNDIYYQINEINYNEYSYLEDFADKNIASQVVPIYLSTLSNFKSAQNKDNLLKNYIKNCGALVIALPANSMFMYDQNGYVFNENYIEAIGNVEIKQNHAVTLIGWNDYGFIALNSWGVDGDSSCEIVNISYDVIDKYYNNEILFNGEVNSYWLCGYSYAGNQDIKLIETSADEFSAEDGIVANTTNSIKNIFTYSEAISDKFDTTNRVSDKAINLKFEINKNYNIKYTYALIYRGTEDVTSLFKVSYDEDNYTISVYGKFEEKDFLDKSETFAGGTYSIKFFENDNFIGFKPFSIYTATEVTYFEFYDSENKNDKYYSMLNSFASMLNSDTYYISSNKTYNLDLYLTYLNKTMQLDMYILDRQVYNSNTGYFENVTGTELDGIMKDNNNFSSSGDRYGIIIKNIPSSYNGKLVRFRVSINSTKYGSSCVGSYYFQLFVSSLGSASNKINTYDILYSLDGGKNDSRNISVYPIYSVDSNMTSFTLFSPTKIGFEFEGWYLDKDYETKFEVGNLKLPTISGSKTGFLVLYAKWFLIDTEYYSVNLDVISIYNYDKTKKDLTGLDLSESATLIYGDSIKLKTTIFMNEALKNETFAFKYKYSINGVLKSEEDLITVSETDEIESEYYIYFGGVGNENLAFPNLTAGEYEIFIETTAVIRHKFFIVREVSYFIKVEKKEVSIIYDDEASNVVYDKNYHFPQASYEGYYSEDAIDFENVLFDQESKNQAGSYSFTSKNISNSNYYLSEVGKNTNYVLEISKRDIQIIWTDKIASYNGKKHIPAYELIGLISDDTAYVYLDSQGFINAGNYTFKITGLSNSNYNVENNSSTDFKIEPAKISIRFDNVEERAQSSSKYRTGLTYSVEGILYDPIENLNIECYSEGLTKNKSGEYPITATYNNSNYYIEFIEGKYILTGYYYIYYTLPNGEIYKELVNYGEDPKGITDDIYKVSALKKIKYSEELVETGDDMYVTVTVEDFSYYIIIGGVIIVFFVIYWFATRKHRLNKVR